MRCLFRGSLPLLVCVALLFASACAQVVKGSVPPPTGSTILLPEQGFTGGVLTGVVLGPDEKPVPNAQVNITDGVPVTLSGEVIGDVVPQKPPVEKPPVEKPPVEKPPVEFPSVAAPQDCAGILARAQSLLGGSGAVDHILIGLSQPSAAPGNVEGAAAGSGGGEGSAFLSRAGGGISTDAQGRFALCVRPDAKNVNVSFADGSVQTAVPTAVELPPSPCDQASHFFQPASQLSLCQRLHNPHMAQGDKTWELQQAVAISSGGDHVLTTLRTPRDLQPGEATLSYVDGSGQARSFTGGVFKIVSARLDHSKLHSNQGADFDYEAMFSPQWGGKQLCVNLGTTGPIILVKPPAERLDVNGDGHASIKGKIRATQVAPGSTVPFVIQLNVSQCGPGPQSAGEKAPGPTGTPGEKAPGPIGTSGEKAPGPSGSPSDTEMKLSLTPAPAVPNPFVQRDSRDVTTAPQAVAMKPPSPNLTGPEHTMDSTNKYAKAPEPMSPCKFQTKTPVITAVEGISHPTVFTQQQGLNYFTIHGCNFGSTPGHVYLVMHPDDGPGFPQLVDLYLIQGNQVWTPDSISVYMNPQFGGYLDQTGDVLRVVTSNNLTAELPNQVFHAERVALVMAWTPRSQVSLGTASDPLIPEFKTTAPSQSSSDSIIMPRNATDSVTVTVTRSVSNVGGPFTVQDDTWDFSQLRRGFEVMYATPYYDGWNGAGCDQTSGKWGTTWDSATQLRVHVQGCYHGGTGFFRSSTAHYGLQIELRGPKGALPWPDGLK